MEVNISFYDLLKKEYEKKKVDDVMRTTRENILQRLKSFAKSLSKRELIGEAIDHITEIKNLLEKEECLYKYDITQSDLDLISLIKAVVLCSDGRWPEAEDLLYQLTDKYDAAVFYALLGVTKNKRKIFKCCRDTLTVAQLQSKTFQSKPFKFDEIDVAVTNLSNAELKNAIKVMMIYTKDMRELPSNPMGTENFIELNLSEVNSAGAINIGKVVRNSIFPTIRDRIDAMLRIKEPEPTSVCLVSDKCTQTEYAQQVSRECQTTQTENFTSSREIKSDIIRTSYKSTQVALEKLEPKKNKELLALRTTVNLLNKENDDLRLQLKGVNENFRSSQLDYKAKVFKLERQMKTLRMTADLRERTNFDLQLTTQQLLEKVFQEIHLAQKAMCEEAKIKYDAIDAVIVALRDDLERLGLKNDLDTAASNTDVLRKKAINLESEIEGQYRYIKQFIVSNQLDALLHVQLVNSVLSEPPNILLDFISKLVPMCRNNGAYRAELIPNAAQPNLPGPSCPMVAHQISNFDFPLIAKFKKRNQHRIVEEAIFETYITDVQKFLPRCSRQQIARCVNAIRRQRKVPLIDIGVQDVVDFLNSTVVSIRQSDLAGASSSSIGFWDVDNNTEYSENVCPICLETCTSNVTVLECTHSYHSPCIREWLNANNQCPICRRAVRLDIV